MDLNRELQILAPTIFKPEHGLQNVHGRVLFSDLSSDLSKPNQDKVIVIEDKLSDFRGRYVVDSDLLVTELVPFLVKCYNEFLTDLTKFKNDSVEFEKVNLPQSNG